MESNFNPKVKWLDTSSAEAAAVRQKSYWEEMSTSLQCGTFWVDRISQLRGMPTERLKLAIDNLPLPAAFHEAAVAIRSLIRYCIKSECEFADELALLYWLAAIDSFSVSYSERLRQPGFNVMQSVPGDAIRSLSFSYQDLGYKHLSLLNKSDVRWLVSRWGEPTSHTTLNAIHRDQWQKFEQAEFERQQREHKNRWQP